jgi:hypothetical protein
MLISVVFGCSLTEAECPDAVTLRFENADSNRITWDGDCIVNDLNVERVEDNRTVWSAHGRLRSPIMYGESKQGIDTSEPEPLVVGQRYRVTLWKEERSTARMIATVQFVYGS